MQLSNVIGHLPLYAEDVLPACLVIVVICLLEWGIGKVRGYALSVGHILTELLFAIYLIVLVQMTVPFATIWHTVTTQGFVVLGNVMLTPLREIRNFWYYGSRQEILRNLVGNIVMFLPLGLFPPLLWRRFRRPWWSWLWWIIPSMVVEILQLLTYRVTSVDDVILNAIGGVAGYLLFWLLYLFGVREGTLLHKKAPNKIGGGKRLKK